MPDVVTTLAGQARAAADAVVSLGGRVYVATATRVSLRGRASVAVTPTPPTLLGRALAAAGPVVNGYAAVQAAGQALLAGRALAGPPRPVAGAFLPTDGRRFAAEERQYLQVLYQNYPLAAQTADIRWSFDDTVLPVNGLRLEIKEPVRETVVNTLGARTLTITEEELDTPRVTRNRQFVLEFPPLGLQLLQFLTTRMRCGVEFTAEFRLLDVAGNHWERLYTDVSDPDFGRRRYWGTLAWWLPGSVRLRVNGVEITDFSDGSVAVSPIMGGVEFYAARSPADRVEAQYTYAPRVRLMELDPQPKAGTAFQRFGPRLTLVELAPRDPAFGATAQAVAPPPPPPPAAGYSDTFTRADGPATQLETGQAWVRTGSTLAAAKLQIAAQAALPGANIGGDNAYTVLTDGTDGFLSAQVWQNADAGYPALLGRYSASLGMYELVYEFDDGFPYPTYHLYRNLYGGGGRTELWRGGYGQHAEGDTWGLKFAGTEISVYLNGVRYATVTDSDPTLAATRSMGARVAGTQRLDNFAFRRPAEYYAGLFLPDPNTDWLAGSPVWDTFAKPDGGLGFAGTGQGWLNADSYYPTFIANGTARGAVGGLLAGASADGVVEVHGTQRLPSAHAPYCMMRVVQSLGVRTDFLWFGLTSGFYQILAFHSNTYTLTGPAPLISGPASAPLKLELAGAAARGWAQLSGVWTLVYTGTVPGGQPSSSLHGFGVNDAGNEVTYYRFGPGPVVP